MTDHDSDTLRCLMEALESRISPDQARDDCGCTEKARAFRPTQPLNQGDAS